VTDDAARTQRKIAVMQLGMGALLLIGVWMGLPARYWPLDLGGSALALLCLASGAGLLARKPWGARLARVTSWIALACGLALTTALGSAIAHLAGSYGPVGAGGAALMFTIALLVLPYLVGLPLLHLAWLRRAG
jgi:hypothetical protein